LPGGDRVSSAEVDIITTSPSTVDNEIRPDRAAAADRTKVILLSQIVVIVALLVAWSIIRGTQSAGRSAS
jgi:hypothetical protein